MKIFNIKIIILLLFIIIQKVSSQCCLKFSGNQCITCPQSMHVYRGNCIYNIPNCKTYLNGFDCSQCNQGYKIQNNECKINSTNNATVANPSVILTPTDAPKQYDDFAINIPLDHTSEDQRMSRASVAQDIFTSTYQTIRYGTVTKAFDRVFKNGTKFIYLYFKPKNGQNSYEGVMEADLDTFIFRQISFKKYEEPKELKPIKSDAQNTNNTNNSANGNNSSKNNNQTTITNTTAAANNNTQSNSSITNSNNQSSNNSSQSNSNSSNNSKPNSTSNVTVPNTTSNTNTSLPSLPLPSNATNSSSSSNKTNTTASKYDYFQFKFTQILDIFDALSDINYVICLNQINTQIAQIDGFEPYKILKQDKPPVTKNTSNNGSNKFQHYISTFKLQKGLQIQVRCRIDLTTFVVKIDQVIKRNSTQQATTSSTSTSSSSPSPISSSSQLDFKALIKTNFTQQSSDPSQADIFFLIFLDNVGKAVDKKLLQINQKSQSNQIIYAGKLQSKDQIYFWVENTVVCASKSKKLFILKGNLNKVTYEVKIVDIIVSDLKQGNDTKSTVSSINNTSNINNTTSPVVDKQIKDPKQILSTSNTANISNSSNKTTTTGQNSSTTTNSTSNIPKNSTSNSTLNSASNSTSNSTSNSVAVATNNTSSNATNSTKIINSTGSNTSSSSNTSTNFNTSTIINSTNTTTSSNTNSKPSNTSSQTIINTTQNTSAVPSSTSNSTNTSNSISPVKQAALYSEQIYQSINQTIRQKAAGFEQMELSNFSKDDALNQVSNTIISTRATNKVLYKAYIKSMGIKAEYKLYYLDNSPTATYIIVYEGYATFDLLRKRVFVMAFGQIN